MSMRANPTTIGLFLLGALVIAIIGTALLATATWFQQRTTFISFFPESVNGLENGAPVKFQGVPVGTVTGINIQIDQRDESFQVPVE
ncbi:MAG: MlaD family protein, partial [Gemmatimonadaceae bacterium]